MPNKNIKNCPFCDGYAKIRKKNRTVINGTTVRNTFIYCPTCDSRGTRILYREFETQEQAEQEAINRWNKRRIFG